MTNPLLRGNDCKTRLMLPGSTGFTPLILELAVGLERMSPLGIVAGMGLLIGTFLTMIVIPVVYSSIESLVRIRIINEPKAFV